MLRPYIVRSRAVSIAGGGPVYTSMSALPDRDRSGQARVDEPALVARALAGDREALGTLVQWYAGSAPRDARDPRERGRRRGCGAGRRAGGAGEAGPVRSQPAVRSVAAADRGQRRD